MRLKDACKGEAAVDMALLRKKLEKRVGVGAEERGGGAIAGRRLGRVSSSLGLCVWHRQGERDCAGFRREKG